jgi:hypothetical protein
MADRVIEPFGPRHFNRKPRRKAEFIRPPNTLKAKVGSGGLSDDILTKAQELLENNAVDFLPLAEVYLAAYLKAVRTAENAAPGDGESEKLIAAMIYPAMQLKANGGMFHFPLVSSIANKLIEFLEVIEEPNADALEICHAFHTTLRAVVLGRITGDGGHHGDELRRALEEACERYFEQSERVYEKPDYTSRF